MKDHFQYFTVKVADGSGCLFQPLDSEYSYVLTAKHVIEGVEDISIIRQYTNAAGHIENETLTILTPPYLHSDTDKDAAIIKVDKVDNIASLLRADLDSCTEDDWYLCGHPESRRSDDFSYRKNQLRMENPAGSYIEAKIKGSIERDEVVGQSGGGIIKSEQSCCLLAGIQSRMAVDDSEELLSRIHFAPLSFFDEIIEENKEQLSPLFPPYIGDFSHLLQDIFPLPNLLIKPDLIKQTLLSVSENICKETEPNKIIEEFGLNLSVAGTSEHIKYHQVLWKSWLEFLTIIRLWDNESDSLDLSNIHKKKKLLIADTDCWMKKLEDIYKTDLSKVEKNGSIVICATNETSPSKLEISPDELSMICNISTPIDKMNIHNTVQNPFEDLKLVNIFKFQHHIINNVMKLRDINAVNSKEKLKELTNEII